MIRRIHHPADRRVLYGAFPRLEPCAGKLARTVLRGRGGGNVTLLPDSCNLPIMLDYKLFKQEFAELCAAHRWALNVREAYRINAVILLGNGRTAADIAVALLIDTVTVCTYFNRYKKCGIGELLRINYVGDEAFLDDD